MIWENSVLAVRFQTAAKIPMNMHTEFMRIHQNVATYMKVTDEAKQINV